MDLIEKIMATHGTTLYSKTPKPDLTYEENIEVDGEDSRLTLPPATGNNTQGYPSRGVS